MRTIVGLILLAVSLTVKSQQLEIQRALIERDQQSAEFAAQLKGSQESLRQLENLHARVLSEALQPLSPEPALAQHFLPYRRQRMAQQRFDSPLFRPAERPDLENPLPLPGGLKAGVDPVTAHGVRR